MSSGVYGTYVNVGPFDGKVEVLGKGLWIRNAVCSW